MDAQQFLADTLALADEYPEVAKFAVGFAGGLSGYFAAIVLRVLALIGWRGTKAVGRGVGAAGRWTFGGPEPSDLCRAILRRLGGRGFTTGSCGSDEYVRSDTVIVRFNRRPGEGAIRAGEEYCDRLLTKREFKLVCRKARTLAEELRAVERETMAALVACSLTSPEKADEQESLFAPLVRANQSAEQWKHST